MWLRTLCRGQLRYPPSEIWTKGHSTSFARRWEPLTYTCFQQERILNQRTVSPVLETRAVGVNAFTINGNQWDLISLSLPSKINLRALSQHSQEQQC